MPTPKRWFHCSQEINLDPEVWALTERFGDRAIRTWLQILSYLDRSENRWSLTEESLKTVGRITRQYPKSCRSQILWMISCGWLVELPSDSNKTSTVLQSPNWLKYNKSQETKKQSKDSSTVPVRDSLLSLPSLSSPNLTNKEKSSVATVSMKPRRPSLLPDEEWLKKLKEDKLYSGIDIDMEYRKASAWFPERNRTLTRRAFINWLIKAMESKPLVCRNGTGKTCQERIQRGNFLKPCGEPAVTDIAGRPLCQTHKEYHEQRASHSAT